MPRSRWFAIAAGLSAPLSISAGCDHSASSMGSPTIPSTHAALSPFSLSGVITEYRAGPLANVTVSTATKTMQTGANGFYRFDGLTGQTGIFASKDGYDITGRGDFLNTEIVNITLNRRLQIRAGETLSATIWGDSSLYEEDDYTGNLTCGWGGNTPTRACRLIHVTADTPGTLTVRLSFHEAVLGIFISYGFPGGGKGVSGPSTLEVSSEVPGGNTSVIVSFENPSSSDAVQTFELATSFVSHS